jgi:hypothetical protein
MAISSRTQIKKTKPHSNEVCILTPQVGDIVLIAKHMGSRRLPKCIGVVKSTGYVRSAGSQD